MLALSWAAILLATCYLIFDVYTLNRGFSLWDEAYYVLSYQMAAEGFFRHFNNTPFLVAFLFERFHPGLIGYRFIHLVLEIAGAAALTHGVIRFAIARAGLRLSKAEQRMLQALGFLAATYIYPISVATLSYNHLNEFLAVSSLALFLLALARDGERGASVLMLAAGAILAVDLYVKPPGLIDMLLAQLCFLGLFDFPWKRRLRLAGCLLAGCALSIALSVLLFYPLSQWAAYLSLMKEQQAHEPMKILTGFLSSAADMFRSSGAFIVSGIGLGLGAWLMQAPRAGVLPTVGRRALVAGLAAVHSWFAWRFLLPADIRGSFGVHWWYWWVYSSTTLLAVSSINFTLVVAGSLGRSGAARKSLVLLVGILAATPVGLAVGTLNGFGQVQIHGLPWLLLGGLAVALYARSSSVVLRTYPALLLLVFACVGAAYVVRQQQPGNFSGQGATSEQKYSVDGMPPLRGILVDQPTHDFLTQIKAILDRYPGYPTLVFFDMPGLQYAFGRRWAVLDPWLTNYEQPLTKDDVYNCRVITSHPEKLHKTIFIVNRFRHIDRELSACLASIGFPDRLQLLGTVDGKVAGLEEPVRIYLYP